MIMKSKEKAASAEPEQKDQQALAKIIFREDWNLKEFSEKTGISSKVLIDKLNKKGFSVDLTDTISENLANSIGQIFKLDVKLISIEEQMRMEAENHPEDMVARPPVVTIMGHVDHGKTTLLDAIHKSNLIGKEHGGITQHIGAYRIFHDNRFITFIDTPGHEAFTQLRSRGAKVTDIVVLVVAADDGVMPQTREAVNHAKAAGVPIIVAINKIDKPEADIEKAKQQLSKVGLLVESWGGDTVSVEVSAKEKTNLNELLEMILLLSDVLEIKANPKIKAQGVILEARLDAKKGPIATVLIQHGVLTQGEALISGTCLGKVRALFDEKGKTLKKAEPSMPVEILGFSDVPTSGDVFQAVSDLETARKIVQLRSLKFKKEEISRPEHLTLDQLFQKIDGGEAKELPLIIKADVHGSVEVLVDTLPNLSSEQVKIKIIHSATGNISESDVLLASASNAIIIGYNTKPNQKIMDIAKEEKVEIRSYNVIYQLIEDIKRAMSGLLEPVLKETYLGRAEIRKLFHVPRIGVIAGCFVTDGKIVRNAEARVLREGEVVHTGRISSLKHLKENVNEVKKDYECGISLEKFKDIQEGDTIEAFLTQKVRPE